MANYPKCPMCGATGPVGADHTHCGCVLDAVLDVYIKKDTRMKLDDAAAAYVRTINACSIQSDEGDATPGETFHVRLHDGTILNPGMSHDDAIAFLAQESGRSAVVAVLREIISPDVLSRAAHHAGCTLRKFENNALNNGRKPSLALLEGLLTALEEDSTRG